MHAADPRPVVDTTTAKLELFVGHVIGRDLLDHALNS